METYLTHELWFFERSNHLITVLMHSLLYFVHIIMTVDVALIFFEFVMNGYHDRLDVLGAGLPAACWGQS